jgi:hypothetical protein
VLVQVAQVQLAQRHLLYQQQQAVPLHLVLLLFLLWADSQALILTLALVVIQALGLFSMAPQDKFVLVEGQRKQVILVLEVMLE